MKQCFFVFAALSCAALTTSTAFAAAIDAIPANGQILQLEDDDFEILVNSGGSISSPGADRIVDTGDFFVGMIRISNIQQPIATLPPVHDYDENGGETISAIFAARATKSGSAGSFTFSFDPLTDAEWTSVGLEALFGARVSSDTTAIVFDDPNNIAVETAGDGDVTDDLLTVNGTRLWELGTPAANPDLFFAATGPSDDVSQAGLATFLNVNGAMDVTFTFPGNPLVLLPLDISRLGIPGRSGQAQVLVNGTAFGGGDTDFDVTTDTDFFIAAVPEPTSITLFALGGLSLLGVGYRRRQATKKSAA